jgi:hypothetical protein
MSYKILTLQLNNIFDELNKENIELKNKLLLAEKRINILNKFKSFCVKFESLLDSKDRQLLNDLEIEYKTHFINEIIVTNNEDFTQSITNNNNNNESIDKRIDGKNIGKDLKKKSRKRRVESIDKKRKRIKTNENNNEMSAQNNDLIKRQSFSDRICDDLCEVLLKYLSFEDKIKFECVSKQFQRCVYNKQFVLDINCDYVDPNKRQNLLRNLINSKKNSMKINFKPLKNILMKCKFINKIIVNKHFTEKENILLIIANNCQHLKSIDFDFSEIKEEVLVEFGQKCGHHLREISFKINYRNEFKCYKKLLNLCSNLLSISYSKLSDFIDNESILVPKVTQIKDLIINKEYKLMEVLANCCSNTLKTLTINFIHIDENGLSFLMKQISRLVNLEKLSLNLRFNINASKSLIDGMKKIGINCAKIKSLRVRIRSGTSFIISDLFNSIGSFSQIKLLNCEIDPRVFYYEQIISIKSLEKCKQLKHLVITTNEKISNIAFNSLSKLNKLKSIELSAGYSKSITDEEIINIINNCQEIETIKLFEVNITHKTIDALIELALKRPHIQFVHQFSTILMKNNHKRAAIYQNETDLPNNLVITIDQDSNKWKKFYFKA